MTGKSSVTNTKTRHTHSDCRRLLKNLSLKKTLYKWWHGKFIGWGRYVERYFS